MFQTKNIIILEIYRHLIRLLKTLAQNFIKPEFLVTDEIDKISFSNPNIYLSESEIFVGGECEDFIKHLPRMIISDFKNTCLTFYVKAAEEIAIRLPIRNQFFKEFEFLDPNIICLNPTKRDIVTDLPLTRDKFKHLIDKNKAVEEWREILYFYSKEQLIELKNLDIPEFWQELSKAKDFSSDVLKFSNICTLAKLVLSLPHSNASAERIISILNDVKTKKRNRLGNNTVNSVGE